MMAFESNLWGSTLVEFSFDVVRHECIMRFELLDSGERSNHVLTFEAVTELRFYSNIPLPWTYAEVTEVDAEFDSTVSSWRIELMLWSESAGIALRCGGLSLNGEHQDPI